jgi:hypothetical protein
MQREAMIPHSLPLGHWLHFDVQAGSCDDVTLKMVAHPKTKHKFSRVYTPLKSLTAKCINRSKE